MLLLHSLCASTMALTFLVARSKRLAEEEAVTAACTAFLSRRHRPRRPGGHPPTARPAPAPSVDPRLQILAGLVAVPVQVLATMRTPVGSRIQDPGGLASLASPHFVILLLLALPAAAPRLFSSHAGALRAALRAAFFSLRTIRDPDDVQAVLRGLPSPRRLGLAADLFTLALGARGLALLLAPLVCPLPLLQHLALAAYAVQRCRTTAEMCGLPMLAHPVWRRRIAWVHSVAETLPFPTPRPLLATGAGAGARSPAVDCRVFLNFFQILLGIVLPTLALARMNGPLASPADTAAALPAAQGRRPGQRLGRLRAAVARATACGAGFAAAAEASLQHLCSMLAGRAGSVLLTAASWWVLMGWCWVLAAALEHPSVSAWLGVPSSS